MKQWKWIEREDRRVDRNRDIQKENAKERKGARDLKKGSDRELSMER